MPSLTVPRPGLAAAVVGILLLGGCSATSAPVSGTLAPLREAVDVVALDKHRSAYLGDANRTMALAAAVGVGAVGSSTFALSTDRRPYVLTIEFASLADGVTPTLANELMTDRAALLLATIRNADEVRWVLPGGEDTVGVLTRAVADELAGEPVAELGETLEGLDHLAERLER